VAAPDHRPELKFLQLYVDEAGAFIARGEFELNHDLWIGSTCLQAMIVPRRLIGPGWPRQ
jgi:hypothetical protein